MALKIKKARMSEGALQEDQEVQALVALENFYSKRIRDEPRCFTRLLDAFKLVGPNGSHNCLVTEVVGPSLSRVLRACDAFNEVLRPDTVLRTTKRLLSGIDFAHSAGVIHGGNVCKLDVVLLDSDELILAVDISFGNVAFTCDLALSDEEDIFDILGGRPTIAQYIGNEALPANLPSQLVKCVDWDMWTDRDEEDVRLIDWGLAFPMGQVVTSIAQPIDLRSPETFFSAYLDHQHDLWRAGCVVCD